MFNATLLIVVMPILLIAFGTVVSSYSETSFVVIGFLYFSGSVIGEAFRVVFIQRMMSRNKLGAVEVRFRRIPVIRELITFLVSISAFINSPSLNHTHLE